MEYNKLVRDGIPDKIQKAGEEFKIHIATEEEYNDKLKEKLVEEANEFASSGNVEELADLLEVMMALARSKGIDWSEVEHVRKEKLEKRGGFDKRIILDES